MRVRQHHPIGPDTFCLVEIQVPIRHQMEREEFHDAHLFDERSDFIRGCLRMLELGQVAASFDHAQPRLRQRLLPCLGDADRDDLVGIAPDQIAAAARYGAATVRAPDCGNADASKAEPSRIDPSNSAVAVSGDCVRAAASEFLREPLIEQPVPQVFFRRPHEDVAERRAFAANAERRDQVERGNAFAACGPQSPPRSNRRANRRPGARVSSRAVRGNRDRNTQLADALQPVRRVRAPESPDDRGR